MMSPKEKTHANTSNLPNVATRVQIGMTSDNGKGSSRRMDRQAIVSTENNGLVSNNDLIDDNTDEDTGDNLGESADTLILTLAENSRS